MRSYPALLAMLWSLVGCAVVSSGCASADSDSLVLLRIGGDVTGVHRLRITARLLGSAERTSTPALLPAHDVCLGTCTMAFDDAGMPDSGMMSVDASRPLDGSTGVDAMTSIDAAVTSVDSGTPTCASWTYCLSGSCST